MRWLFTAARRLRELGIVGMNHRNAACILDHNPRTQFPVVNDKLRLQNLCARIGVPAPALYAAIEYQGQLHRLRDVLQGRRDFVIKPNRGSGGRGILVVVERDGDRYVRHNGERLPLESLRQHLSDILSGMHSLGGRPDQALIQQRVCLHPAFEPIAYKGIPDVRVVLYRNEPAMAMLRLPTQTSNGRANLHQGGIGAGVDLATGVTCHAVQENHPVEVHPDTGHSLLGVHVPSWRQVLDMARRVAEAVGLGYLGVDVVVDATAGPLLLEANARPGLAIQIANGQGLLPRLAEIDARQEQGETDETPDVIPLRRAYRKSA
jgi:alpha-L-glutamate ligase-like protein